MGGTAKNVSPPRTGRSHMIKYFRQLECSLVGMATAAQMPRGNEKDTGENREFLVAKFFDGHLPRCAAVATGGAIIDSETKFSNTSGEHVPSADVLVVNPFTLVAQWFPAGYYPVQSMYLGIEVKSSMNHLCEAFEQIFRIKRLRKCLRPETTYFGFHTKSGKVMDPADRSGSPNAGIWIWEPAGETNVCGKLKTVIEKYLHCDGDPERTKTMMPSFVYVPSRFLAFKTYPKVRDHYTGKMINIAQQRSEYWFGKSHPDLCFANSTGHPFNYLVVPFDASNQESPSLLQILTFWLCQEILKFMHEVPDLFAYACSKEHMKGRQGYGWKPNCLDVYGYEEVDQAMCWTKTRKGGVRNRRK